MRSLVRRKADRCSASDSGCRRSACTHHGQLISAWPCMLRHRIHIRRDPQCSAFARTENAVCERRTSLVQSGSCQKTLVWRFRCKYVPHSHAQHACMLTCRVAAILMSSTLLLCRFRMMQMISLGHSYTTLLTSLQKPHHQERLWRLVRCIPAQLLRCCAH